MTATCRLKRAGVLFSLGLISACAPRPAPPVITAAPAPATPSPAMLRAAWLKGYDAGFADGERLQSQADAEVTAQATVPPPPHVAKPARPAPPVPNPPPTPIASAPPQSIFVPIGPAEPLKGAP